MMRLLGGANRSGSGRKTIGRKRLRVEPLEDRRLLSVSSGFCYGPSGGDVYVNIDGDNGVNDIRAENDDGGDLTIWVENSSPPAMFNYSRGTIDTFVGLLEAITGEDYQFAGVAADLKGGDDSFDGTGLNATWGYKGLADGGSGNDKLDGSPSDDQIAYGAFDPFAHAYSSGAAGLRGGDGHDAINGGGGNDWIAGGTGRDTIDGGNGNDLIYGGNEPNNETGDNINGGDGNDTIYGEDGKDTVDAGPGNDYVDAGRGDDYVVGGSGNDTIVAGDGNDRAEGGSGDDDISGGDGNDTILGDSGNDTIVAGDGNDRADGGSGDDNISGGNGNDSLWGGSGHDTLSGGNDRDQLHGDGDDDWSISGGAEIDILWVEACGSDGSGLALNNCDIELIYGSDCGDYIDSSCYGGPGYYENIGKIPDTPTCSSKQGWARSGVVVFGNSGNDHLIGSDFNDALDGGGGDDLLEGLAGGPVWDSNAKEDWTDALIGGPGTDTVSYERSPHDVWVDLVKDNGCDSDDPNKKPTSPEDPEDRAYAKDSPGLPTNSSHAYGDALLEVENLRGSDLCYEGDILMGDNAVNVIEGLGGPDYINGRGGDDELIGGSGGDMILGSGGADLLDGEAGNDTLLGGDGADLVLGGLGDDRCDGGADKDAMDGGEGVDTMVLYYDSATRALDDVFAYGGFEEDVFEIANVLVANRRTTAWNKMYATRALIMMTNDGYADFNQGHRDHIIFT